MIWIARRSGKENTDPIVLDCDELVADMRVNLECIKIAIRRLKVTMHKLSEYEELFDNNYPLVQAQLDEIREEFSKFGNK